MQTSIPFSDFNMDLNGTTEVSDHVFREGDTAFYSMVSSNFVHASGLRLMQGREFLPQDDGKLRPGGHRERCVRKAIPAGSKSH